MFTTTAQEGQDSKHLGKSTQPLLMDINYMLMRDVQNLGAWLSTPLTCFQLVPVSR